jgi:hypothetical protein
MHAVTLADVKEGDLIIVRDFYPERLAVITRIKRDGNLKIRKRWRDRHSFRWSPVEIEIPISDVIRIEVRV